MSRRRKFVVMGTKIDIDEVYAAQKALEARHAELRRETDAVEQEMEEYRTAIRLMLRFQPVPEKAHASAPDQDETDEDGGLPRGALRKHIENTLNTFARNGATVAAIRDYIRTRHNVDVEPNTVSVTLNRLKKVGVAHLDGQKWSPAIVARHHLSIGDSLPA